MTNSEKGKNENNMSIDEELKLAELEKLKLENSELKSRASIRETRNESKLKFYITVLTPLVAAFIALTAAYLELRSVRGEREKLREEQSIKFEEREVARIRKLVETQSDNLIRVSAANNLISIDPQIAELASYDLVSLLDELPYTYAQSISTVLVGIGTDRVIADLVGFVGSTNSSRKGLAIESISRIGGKSAFNALVEFLGEEDPRIAGRCKFLIARYFQGELKDKILSSETFEDAKILNSYIDILTMMDKPVTSDIYKKLLIYNGNHKIYLNESNPIERILRLAFLDKASINHEFLKGIFRNDSLSIDLRSSAAISLLGNELDEEIENFLISSISDESKTMLLAEALLESDYNTLGKDLILKDFYLHPSDRFTRNYPRDSYYLIQENDFDISTEILLELVKSPNSTTQLISAATLLIKKEPYKAYNIIHEKISGIPLCMILTNSELKEHRTKAIDLWVELIQSGDEIDYFNYPNLYSINILNIPPSERKPEVILDLIKNNKINPDFLYSAYSSLLETDYESIALDSIKNQSITRYFQALKDLELIETHSEEILNSISKVDDMIEGEDRRASFASDIAKLSIGTSFESKAIEMYFRRVDQAKVYKGWHNPSDFLGDPVGLTEMLLPEFSTRCKISFGAKYVSSYAEVLIGWWSHKQLPTT